VLLVRFVGTWQVTCVKTSTIFAGLNLPSEGAPREETMLRPPGTGNSCLQQTGIGVLDYELAGEMAASLGNAGKRAEESLAKLAAHGGGEAERNDLVREAADAVYAYFIQRELCGLKRHDDIVRQMAIPRAVLARLGAR